MHHLRHGRDDRLSGPTGLLQRIVRDADVTTCQPCNQESSPWAGVDESDWEALAAAGVVSVREAKELPSSAGSASSREDSGPAPTSLSSLGRSAGTSDVGTMSKIALLGVQRPSKPPGSTENVAISLFDANTGIALPVTVDVEYVRLVTELCGETVGDHASAFHNMANAMRRYARMLATQIARRELLSGALGGDAATNAAPETALRILKASWKAASSHCPSLGAQVPVREVLQLHGLPPPLSVYDNGTKEPIEPLPPTAAALVPWLDSWLSNADGEAGEALPDPRHLPEKDVEALCRSGGVIATEAPGALPQLGSVCMLEAPTGSGVRIRNLGHLSEEGVLGFVTRSSCERSSCERTARPRPPSTSTLRASPGSQRRRRRTPARWASSSSRCRSASGTRCSTVQTRASRRLSPAPWTATSRRTPTAWASSRPGRCRSSWLPAAQILTRESLHPYPRGCRMAEDLHPQRPPPLRAASQAHEPRGQVAALLLRT